MSNTIQVYTIFNALRAEEKSDSRQNKKAFKKLE
jgi:hypothetical protein